MSRVRGPHALADGTAYMWTVEVDAVPHQVAWCPADGGSLRVSFPLTDTKWSPFVRMGAPFSPQRTVREAADAVGQWAARQSVRA